MGNEKFHHYVARCHLKGFTDPSDKFCTKLEGKPIIHSNQTTKKNFGQNHLNTHYEINGEKNTTLEGAFSKLESQTAPIFERLRKISRNTFQPQLNYSDKLILAEYFYTQLTRHPDFYNDTHDQKVVANLLLGFIFQDGYLLTNDEKACMLSTKEVVRIRQNAIVASRLNPNRKAIARLASFNFAIGVTDQASFIVGDNPIANFKIPIGIPFNNWMPISSKVAIAPTVPHNIGTQYIRFNKNRLT